MSTPHPTPRTFWSTLPGLLTALAGIITATGGLLAVLVHAGLIGRKADAPAAAAPGEAPAAVIAGGGVARADAQSSPLSTTEPAPRATEPTTQTAAASDASLAGPPPTADAAAYTAVRVTPIRGADVTIRPTAEILGNRLPLLDGREVEFDRLQRIEIRQPWDGSLRLILLGGSAVDAQASNLPLSGSNELGPYLAMLSDLRLIEFVR